MSSESRTSFNLSRAAESFVNLSFSFGLKIVRVFYRENEATLLLEVGDLISNVHRGADLDRDTFLNLKRML